MEGEPCWDFLARMSEIFVQRILILVKNNLKVYFLILTSSPKMLQKLPPLPLFLVSFFKETSGSLFQTKPFFLMKKVRENCTVTPKASYSRERIQQIVSTHVLLSFVASNVNIDQGRNWSIFCRCQRREKAKNVSKNVLEQTENVHSKIHTSTTQRRRHSSFLNNLVYCERNVEPFTQFHSSATPSFLTSSSKEPLTRTCISLFSAEAGSFIGFRPKTQFHPSSTHLGHSSGLYFLDFLAQSVKCCESFAYVAPFDVSLYILKNY